RGQASDEVIARRMQDAESEMSHWAEFDYVVINDDFDVALAELLTIFRSQRLRQPNQAAAQSALIESLLN
ncbi:MAG: guanylate kinase, partial [Gammaproteobacteria bacterium]|nr:guanylate kinase [Gammaproteobacteria bacterium]